MGEGSCDLQILSGTNQKQDSRKDLSRLLFRANGLALRLWESHRHEVTTRRRLQGFQDPKLSFMGNTTHACPEADFILGGHRHTSTTSTVLGTLGMLGWMGRLAKMESLGTLGRMGTLGKLVTLGRASSRSRQT